MGKKRPLIFLLVFLAIMIGYAVTAGTAEPGRHVMLILDASGSMWGRIGGKAKITIAQEVLSGIIQDLPSDLQAGLTVYGHRKIDDCNDVEELVQFAPLDRNRLISIIRSLKPKGKTPIAHSIMLAADKMKPLGQAGTIILVSDGEETCGGDPCKLTADLKAKGLDFTMHVVGFGVKGAASEQLACIARAGGGTYAEAADARKLKLAIAGALEKTLDENLVVRAVHAGKAKAGRPASLEAVVTVSRDGVQVAEARGAKAGFKLDPGAYDITVAIPSLQQTKRLEKVAIAAAAKTEKEVPFSVSALGVRVVDSLDKPIEAYLKIFPQNQDVVTAEGWSGVEQPRLFALRPDTYRIEIVEPATDQKLSLDVVLPEDQEVVEKVSFGLAKLGVFGQDSLGKPINVHVKVYRQGETDNEAASDWSNASREHFFELPPGTYDVTVEENKSNQTIDLKSIVLEPGAEVVREVSFAKAKLGVRGKDSLGKPINVHVKVFRRGETDNEAASDWSNAGRKHFFELPPGIYDVTVEENKSNQTIDLKSIILEPGAGVIKELSF
ncbi:MAG: VWA domain-containing protein [Pseudomonadota bacterium]